MHIFDILIDILTPELNRQCYNNYYRHYNYYGLKNINLFFLGFYDTCHFAFSPHRVGRL